MTKQPSELLPQTPMPKEVVLPKDANPEQWHSLKEREVDAFRSIHCSLSGLCVGYAVFRGWKGFTCIYCQWHKKGGKPLDTSHSLVSKTYDRRDEHKILLDKQKT